MGMAIAKCKAVGTRIFWRYESEEQFLDMWPDNRFIGPGWYYQGEFLSAQRADDILSHLRREVRWAEHLEKEMLKFIEIMRKDGSYKS